MDNILDLLKLTRKEKIRGLWLLGVSGEGERKRWYSMGQLWEHSNWKDGELHGEFREYHSNGQLFEYSNWKDGKRHGEEKWWHNDGKLYAHELWEKGKMIKDYLK